MTQPVTQPGRTIPDPGFAGDDGTVTPALGAALAAYDDSPEGHDGLLAVLAGARLLVPIVASATEVEVVAGLAHDKTSDMATVLLQGADGRLAQLAFSSLETLRRWDSEARPVPVRGDLAARAAVYDGAAALLLDLAGPVPVVIETEDLRALAAGAVLGRVGDERIWIRPSSG